MIDHIQSIIDEHQSCLNALMCDLAMETAEKLSLGINFPMGKIVIHLNHKGNETDN